MHGPHKNSNLVLKPKGFTLIELLVVIAIIALLLSILMPALGKVKKLAQSLICRSRLDQIGLALVLYAEANNDAFLLHEWASDPTNPNYDEDSLGDYFARIAPYIAVNINVHPHDVAPFLRCPSGDAIKDFGDEFVFGNIACDYGLQAWPEVQPGWGIGDVVEPGKFYNIKQPDNFATFFDFFFGNLDNPNVTSGAVWSGKWFLVVDLIRSTSRNVEFTRSKAVRHNNGVNALFADGHVEYIKDPDWWDDMASPSSIGWANRD